MLNNYLTTEFSKVSYKLAIEPTLLGIRAWTVGKNAKAPSSPWLFTVHK